MASGLRERGKTKRRTAIIRAAHELFGERGYAATTIADIAERAEVAPRTVTGYFPSKEEIALVRFTEAADRLAHAFRNHKPDESALDVLTAWLLSKHDSDDPDGIRALTRRMYKTNPNLRALRAARMEEAVALGAEALAKELGISPGDITARIASAAAAAIAIDILDNTPDDELDDAVATVRVFLQAGLGALTARRRGGEST
ncbi:TetR/AcrR family transcriptional regulator [Streptomyces liangshanensis]|nr:TetR/AcrR family transcriptional regulator [Streptomyces liangshanensis]